MSDKATMGITLNNEDPSLQILDSWVQILEIYAPNLTALELDGCSIWFGRKMESKVNELREKEFKDSGPRLAGMIK